jgi:hypothetical protein
VFLTITGWAAQADIVMISWGHGALVVDGEGSAHMRYGGETLGSPFAETAFAQYRQLSAAGDFTAVFDEIALDASLHATQSLMQTVQIPADGELFSSVWSSFWFSATTDVEVAFAGVMSFHLGDDEAGGDVSFAIRNSNQDLIHQRAVGCPFGGQTGTVTLHDTILLDGGSSYFAEVSTALGARVRRYPRPESTAVSDIAISITSVPEPASGLLLCCGLLLASRRRP